MVNVRSNSRKVNYNGFLANVEDDSVLNVSAILLAAGSGTRFGGDKLLHPLSDGVAIGAHAARNLISAGLDVIAVVKPGDFPLADMPLIKSTTIAAIARELEAGRDLVAPAYAGQRGHPVGLGRRFGPQLLALDGDAGARELIAAHKDELVLVECGDPGVLHDIDRREDLAH